ncbi:MAG: hypothetical protein LUQ28_10820 [Methylococcaceae bacterium]|nr:hypothetical protein [Methylococcaceae bacterium]
MQPEQPEIQAQLEKPGRQEAQAQLEALAQLETQGRLEAPALPATQVQKETRAQKERRVAALSLSYLLPKTTKGEPWLCIIGLAEFLLDF